MKIAAAIAFALFSTAVFVQLNDPDPIRWIVMYGVAAVLAGMAFFDRYHYWLTAIACATYAASAVYMSPALAHTSLEAFSSVGMSNVQDELVREFWGLIFCWAWCLALLLKLRGSSQSGDGALQP